MVCAELDRTTIVIDMSGSQQQFVATGEVIRFDGFLRLYSESTDDEQSEQSGEGLLPKMAKGDRLLAQQITATERFTQAPARYNEASLVKRLEELGIGRPSTYAPTITTIINRGYVVKQSKEGQKRTYTQLTLADGRISRRPHGELRQGEEPPPAHRHRHGGQRLPRGAVQPHHGLQLHGQRREGVRPHRRGRHHVGEDDR